MNDTDRRPGGDPFETVRRLAAEDPRVQAGVEHLQAAAREMIAASRALLDLAEDVVDDPRSAGDLLGVVSSFADLAARSVKPRPPRGAHHDAPGPDGDDEPPVERITVS